MRYDQFEAENIPERIGAQKPNQRVKLSDPILQRRTGQTPFVSRLERERCFGGVGGSFLDVVGFIQHNSISQINNVPSEFGRKTGLPVPFKLMHRRFFLDEFVSSLKTALLPSERSFQCPIRNENLCKARK